MKYRKLGRTDLLVSEIGFDCTYMNGMAAEDLSKMFDVGMAAGMNILDFCLAEAEVRDAVGVALEGRRALRAKR